MCQKSFINFRKYSLLNECNIECDNYSSDALNWVPFKIFKYDQINIQSYLWLRIYSGQFLFWPKIFESYKYFQPSNQRQRDPSFPAPSTSSNFHSQKWVFAIFKHLEMCTKMCTTWYQYYFSDRNHQRPPQPSHSGHDRRPTPNPISDPSVSYIFFFRFSNNLQNMNLNLAGNNAASAITCAAPGSSTWPGWVTCWPSTRAITWFITWSAINIINNT